MNDPSPWELRQARNGAMLWQLRCVMVARQKTVSKWHASLSDAFWKNDSRTNQHDRVPFSAAESLQLNGSHFHLMHRRTLSIKRDACRKEGIYVAHVCRQCTCECIYSSKGMAIGMCLFGQHDGEYSWRCKRDCRRWSGYVVLFVLLKDSVLAYFAHWLTCFRPLLQADGRRCQHFDDCLSVRDSLVKAASCFEECKSCWNIISTASSNSSHWIYKYIPIQIHIQDGLLAFAHSQYDQSKRLTFPSLSNHCTLKPTLMSITRKIGWDLLCFEWMRTIRRFPTVGTIFHFVSCTRFVDGVSCTARSKLLSYQ